MVINGANIVGAKVVTKDKKTIDTVRDIVFNQKSKKIDAFILSNKNQKALLFKDAKKVGEDTISIDSGKVLKDVKNVVSDAPDKNYFAATKVVSEKGKVYGFFKDVFFDTSKGTVRQIAVHDRHEQVRSALLLINIEDITKFGDDAIVVKQQPIPSNSGSQGLVEQTKEGIQYAVEQTKAILSK
jgi:sporulation protein YlmC with PRC-barrel domain